MFQRIFLTAVALCAVVLGIYYFDLLKAPTIHDANGRTMGTTWSARYVLDEQTGKATPEQAKAAIDQALEAVNQSMSTYIPDSELMSLNDRPVNTPVKVSDELFRMVEQADHVSRLSGGAYDVTAGNLVNLWGFGSVDGQAETGSEQSLPEQVNEHSQAAFQEWMAKGRVATVPAADAIAGAKQNTGFQSLILDQENRTITKTKPVFIDLSSIAKGYGVDRAAKALEQLGITSYMVEVGGEIRLRGHKPDGKGWRIAVREPVLEQGINTIVSLDNRAIATSGDYLNYYEVEGVHFSHLIDARTGYPEQHRLASVAVIADETSLADAYATMFMILGEKEGMRVAKEQGIDAYFIYHTDNGFTSSSTGNFDSYRVDK
ncbi:FAD:protein FMN transferase [Parendozoicomonas haliclonae]|uniref:FAD:protein FMN transferase n=1 Tax=Parendozoicomonas haliclonae TaxID=1960125 RepID=UPI0013FE2D8C|nr:FAD:protein FMN transferase [Parendozoicomonas haliclonae]